MRKDVGVGILLISDGPAETGLYIEQKSICSHWFTAALA